MGTVAGKWLRFQILALKKTVFLFFIIDLQEMIIITTYPPSLNTVFLIIKEFLDLGCLSPR